MILSSQPSKLRAVRSLHKHHTSQWVTTFQITLCLFQPNIPCQESNKSLTCRDITQCTLKKGNTVSHNSLAIGQFISRWSTDSPSALHMQHQLTNTIFFFLKLSTVRIFPKRSCPNEENYTMGDLRLPKTFPRKRHGWRRTQAVVVALHRKTLLWIPSPTNLITPLPVNRRE